VTKVSHQYERFIARNATMLTGPSQKCDEYFKRIGVKKEVNLIPNSADLEAFDYNKFDDEKKAALKAKLGIDPQAMIVCFAGRLGKEKSIDVLLDCWGGHLRKEDGFHLLIMGDGAEREALEEMAGRLGIREMVTFTGMINHRDMPGYYAISDIFASASLSEMNSISMLESMASGLPVLQRFDELNADQITSGVNGHLWATPADFVGLLREIKALSPEKLRELKAQVRSTVVDRGSTNLAAYMFQIYERAQAQAREVTVRRGSE
jgi:1,2-diacylglycerol 3-alpha-glucosyltransferase